MDPNATLLLWATCVIAGRKRDANEAYNNLRCWLERGGFEPAWGQVAGFARLPKREQFFAYNPRTGKLAAGWPVEDL